MRRRKADQRRRAAPAHAGRQSLRHRRTVQRSCGGLGRILHDRSHGLRRRGRGRAHLPPPHRHAMDRGASDRCRALTMSNERVNELVDHLFRREAGRIASRLTRVFGAHRLDLIEDAVQYALMQALQHWPYQGVPDNTHAWLSRVASNRALDVLRADRKLRSMDADDPAGLDQEIEALSVAATQDQLKFAAELEDEQLGLM